ncbi:MAG: mechanosensitive ion channel family protein [Opitutaceae bacterium]|nr:mechanosensitive ion channel family protein [Opitutaceae bacterium]
MTLESIIRFLNQPFVFGNLTVTPFTVIKGVALFVALLVFTSFIKRLLRNKVLPKAGLDHGVSVAVSTLVGYIVLIVGLLVILPVMIPGFDLSTLSVIIGAVSFGIGFGLRNIADNFVSGLILLIERPIKVGDRIEVEGVYGTVREIRARSTTVSTNDQVDIIVPNSQFISSQVTNASHSGNKVRFRIPVGVHYQSDVYLVKKAMLEAATLCPNVLKDPEASVRFLEFGDSSLNFELWVWTRTLYKRPKTMASEVNFKIWEMFKKYDIEIPYPQQDIYIKELPQKPSE